MNRQQAIERVREEIINMRSRQADVPAFSRDAFEKRLAALTSLLYKLDSGEKHFSSQEKMLILSC
jgi:hypothetical protein